MESCLCVWIAWYRMQEDEEKKKKRAARFGAPPTSEVRFLALSPPH